MKWIVFSIILGCQAWGPPFFNFLAPNAAASDDPSLNPCKGEDIKSIRLPIFPDQVGSPTFNYSFKIRRGSHPSLPVVIYLPGGPGEASIGQFTLDGLGPFTVIQTDPRGVGCNSEAESGTRIPDEGFRSEFLASDVLGIIHELKLDHYVLYGISYGTLLGTIVAAKAEQIGNPPQALVIEGVLGRAFKPGEALQGYIDQWNLLKMRVTPAVRTELKKPHLLGKTSEEWGLWIVNMLKIGVYPYIGDLFLQQLEWLAPGDEDQRTILADTISNPYLKKDPPADVIRLHRNMFCRELADDIPELKSGVLLSDGELIFRSGNFCGDIRLSSPFDSAQLQLSTPIYYFNSENDPTTPMTQARYHYEHQTRAKRYFVTVRGGGHNAFAVNLVDCGKEVWKSLLEGGNELQGALSTCELSSVVEVQESVVK